MYNRVVQIRLAIIYVLVGCVVYALSCIFREDLSDFFLGFCKGSSAVLIFGGVGYLIKLLTKKKSL